MSDDADWPFDQAPNVAALTVRAVLEGAPILHVVHDAEDGGWQFLDGNEANENEARVIGMATALRLDPGLQAIADLPEGWEAWREDVAHAWARRPLRD